MAVSGQKIAMMPRTMAIAPRPSALFQVNDVGVMVPPRTQCLAPASGVEGGAGVTRAG